LFDFCILLVYIFVFTIICKVLHAPFHPALPCVQSLENKIKDKEKENKNREEIRRKEKKY